MKQFTFIPADEGENKAIQIVAIDLSSAINLLFDPQNFKKSEWSIFSCNLEEVL